MIYYFWLGRDAADAAREQETLEQLALEAAIVIDTSDVDE